MHTILLVPTGRPLPQWEARLPLEQPGRSWCWADSRFAPSQWETVLLCNDGSHWLGASLQSALLVKKTCNSIALALEFRLLPSTLYSLLNDISLIVYDWISIAKFNTAWTSVHKQVIAWWNVYNILFGHTEYMEILNPLRNSDIYI